MLNSKTTIFSLQLLAFSLLVGCQSPPRDSKFKVQSSTVQRLPSFRSPTVLTNQNVGLAWDKSSSASVTGYKAYIGNAPRSYTNSINTGTNLTATFSNCISGRTYYFAATAYNDVGLESDFSNEVSYTVPTVPVPPGNLRITFQMQASATPIGPFLDLAGASVTITNQNEPGQFYRVNIATTTLE